MAQPPGPAPPPARAASGAGTKIIVIVLAILAVAGVAVVGGVYYIGHKVKQAVLKTAGTYGVDLNSLPNRDTTSGARTAKVHKVCDLLTTDEVSRLIGEPIERSGPLEQMCGYYGPPGLSTKLSESFKSDAIKKVQPGGNVTGTDMTKMLDQMANTTVGMQLEPGQEMPLLVVGTDPDGKAQFTAMTLAKGIFSGISQASEAHGGVSVGTDIPGLGDKAIRLPKMGLNVLQGETLIRIIPGPFPDADAKTIAVARVVLPRV